MENASSAFDDPFEGLICFFVQLLLTIYCRQVMRDEDQTSEVFGLISGLDVKGFFYELFGFILLMEIHVCWGKIGHASHRI